MFHLYAFFFSINQCILLKKMLVGVRQVVLCISSFYCHSRGEPWSLELQCSYALIFSYMYLIYQITVYLLPMMIQPLKQDNFLQNLRRKLRTCTYARTLIGPSNICIPGRLSRLLRPNSINKQRFEVIVIYFLVIIST